MDRPNQFKIRLADDEVRWLEELADAAGLTKTDYLRFLLRRERERVPPTAATRRKPKRK